MNDTHNNPTTGKELFICPCHGDKYQSRECCLHVEPHDNPTTGEQEWPDDSPAAKAPNSPLVENYLRLFTESILHGDEVHRAWLTEAVECFIEGKHIPEPRAKTAIDKPTAGEWTQERILADFQKVNGIDCVALAAAINAALAAEREKHETELARVSEVNNEVLHHAAKTIQQLCEQLATVKGTLEESKRRLERLGQTTYEIDAALAKIGAK